MFTAGTVVGEYRLEDRIGESGHASVWVARRIDRPDRAHVKLMEPTALVPAARPKAFERLAAAITSVGRLEHPHLEVVLGTVRRPEDGCFGLVTSFVEAAPFEPWGAIADPMVLDAHLAGMCGLAEVLEWLHRRNVVHGNVKPSNVLALRSASPGVLLLDLTWSRAGLGKSSDPSFVPPELTQGAAPSPASDQWSAARVLHDAFLRAAPGRPPKEALKAAPVALLEVLRRALAKEPDARYASMASFARALENVRESLRGEAGRPRPTGLPSPTVPVALEELTAPAAAVVRPEEDEDPEVPEAPTERGRPVRRPAAREELEESRDPTTPLGLGAINPSADAFTRPPRLVPVRPSDATDQVPAIRVSEPPRRSRLLFLGVALAGVASAVLGSTFLLGRTVALPEQVVSLAPVQVPLEQEPRRPAPPEVAASAAPAAPGGTNAGIERGSPPPQERAKVSAPPAASLPAPSPPAASPPAEDEEDAACAAGKASACLAAGRRQLALGGRLGREAAATSFERACNLGSTSACVEAGEIRAEQGSGGAAKARRLYERACDGGFGLACAKLGVLWARGAGGAENARTAEAFERRACQLGHRAACRD